MARNFKEAPLVSTKNSTNSQELGRKLKKIITQVKQNFSDQFKRANIFWDEKVFEIITIFFWLQIRKNRQPIYFWHCTVQSEIVLQFFFLFIFIRERKYLCFRSFLKGGLFLFNYFIDTSPTLMNPFWWKKHVFSLQNHVILTKNGLIRVGLVSIE